MKQVVPVLGEAPPLDQARCLAIVDFLRRCHRADRTEAADPGPRTPTSAGLVQLFRQGRLTFQETDAGTVDLFYTPSRDSSQRLSDGAAETEDNFPEGIRKKQAAAFRVTAGAIFRMPAEQGENEIEIFITDWSPCPAACAVAVHRAHPFVGDLEKRPGSFFSGRYVRHPLTGDLLPVWVADWVKPNFGTGAVLVNPAHDKVDLEFGRKVGLPIRFALVPLSFDSTPATWPRPPVIKTGRSIKTGPYDGLLHTDAMQKYYEVLESQGLAFRHKDVQSGYWRIARLRPDPQSDLLWNPSRLQLAERGSADEGFLPMAVEEAGLVEAALAIAPDSRPALVSPSGEQAESLLAIRLLYYDLHRQPLQVSEVFLVQKVQESKAPVNADVLNLAMLFGSPLQQVLVLKQQVFEQIQRFIRIHGELVKSAGTVASEGDSSKQAQKVKAASLEGDPAKAFSALYQLQKQIEGLSAEQRPGALMAGYFAVAHVLAGLDFPPGVDPATIWSQL